MSARNPDEIWDESVVEGNRRLSRGAVGLAATGLVGGVDVMFGIVALTVVSGALAVAVPEQIAHVGGSLVFGIGFVLLIVGRSELFTENFLVPVGAVLGGVGTPRSLVRLWGVTMVGNLIGVIAFAAILVRAGVVPPDALKAAGKICDTVAERDVVGALLSAFLAGTAMTLFTWLTHAADSDSARVMISLLLGFIIAAPALNHAVVGVGEMAFGLLAGTAEAATWTDLVRNFGIAVGGNLAGGLGFVTVMRVLQVRGEPGVRPASVTSGDGSVRETEPR
jgi:formate-nitrite transporter family protein